jgi:hypothetical protein
VVPAKEAKGFSEVVFRGTVEGFRDSGKGYRLVIFRVDRVWKGRVGPTFEMPAVESEELCWAWPHSMLNIGNELIVYGNRMPGGRYPENYYPAPCQTSLATKTRDPHHLGRGWKPRSK